MEVINGYELTAPFTNDNAGMCRWTFAKKQGKDYFLKEFLSPKYPTVTTGLSRKMVEGMRAEAISFYKKRKVFYDKLNECRTGNVVVVRDFFRYSSKFYIATERMRGPYLSIQDVASLAADKKRVLLKAIVYSMIPLQERGIIHSDLKPDNILIKSTKSGFCTAKLIDFDSGYLENEMPEEIEGDQAYFSPEALLYNAEEEAEVSVKSDIFSLGLLFHQYWSGVLPYFDKKEFHYASEALLEGRELEVQPHIPADVGEVIAKMLSRDPKDRPTAKEIWNALSGTAETPKAGTAGTEKTVTGETPKPPPGGFWRRPTDDDL